MEKIFNPFTIEGAIIGLFIAFIYFEVLNIPYTIKRLFKISPSKYIKILDCFQCSSFWTTLLITQSPVNAMLVFIIAKIYSELNHGK